MKLKRIQLKNFRCYHDFALSITTNLVVLFGPNACGKTSVLEAIFMLGVTKSHRNGLDNDIITFGKEQFLVQGTVCLREYDEDITIIAYSKGKRVKKNGYIYKSLSEYVGTVNVVMFSSTDFLLFTGGPKDRRTFLDLIICQISKDYLGILNSYRKVLKERNALLKRLNFENNQKVRDLLSVITEQLIAGGKKIIQLRQYFVKKLNDLIGEKHHLIASKAEHLQLLYSPNVHCEEYEEQIKLILADDQKRGTTGIGPHKDDCIFIINNKNTAVYASQGQQRTVLLSIKLAVVDLMHAVKGEYPILLLDDVFSELDKVRQNQLVRYLNKDVQTFITTASLADIDQTLLKDAMIINLEKRSV